MEAALAIGKTANELEGLPGSDKLIEIYTQRCFDPNTHKPSQHRFISLAEQLVNQVSGVSQNIESYLPFTFSLAWS